MIYKHKMIFTIILNIFLLLCSDKEQFTKKEIEIEKERLETALSKLTDYFSTIENDFKKKCSDCKKCYPRSSTYIIFSL